MLRNDAEPRADLINPAADGAEVLVLASGGIDSTVLLAFYQKLGRPLAALFIDYGQPAVLHESRAVAQVSELLSVPLCTCRWSGISQKTTGLIVGRNAFLLLAALMEAPASTTTIAIGVHSGTPYGDCSSSFIDQMQSVLANYSSRIAIAAPFVEWSKADVYAFGREVRAPLEITHSCEAGGVTPCGLCASCLDRESLHACT